MQPYEVALQYLGVPFQHRGRTARGVDCVGLLVLVARHFDLPVKDKRVYGREPFRDGLKDYLVHHLGAPVARALEPSDVVLMQWPGDALPSHVAMVAPHPYGLGLVHSYAAAKRVVFHRLDACRRALITEHFAWPARD